MKKALYPFKIVAGSVSSGILFLLLFCYHPEAIGQNTPMLNQTAISGTVTEITTPIESMDPFGNIIWTCNPQVPLQTLTSAEYEGNEKGRSTVEYRNGFNKVFQSVALNHSKSNGDLQDLIVFQDTRILKEKYSFLPYSVSHYANSQVAFFRIAPFAEQRSYYQNRYPDEGYTSYSVEQYHSDGNTRQSKSFAPGKSQVGQARKTESIKLTNPAADVRIWKISSSGNPQSTANYAASELFVQKTFDPEGKTVFIYKDKNGHIVLKRVRDNQTTAPESFAATYYVYDSLGRLRYTLPPKATDAAAAANWVVNASVKKKLCFQYQYDSKGRLAAQSKPGEAGFTFLVYDNKQRLVMRQTANETLEGKWEISYYDKLGRVRATSIYTDAGSRDSWQAAFDAYQTGSFPTNDIRYYLLTESGEGNPPAENAVPGNFMTSYQYYDDYSVLDQLLPNNYTTLLSGLNFSELETIPGAEAPIRSLRTRGLPTFSKLRILPAPGADIAKTGNWQLSVLYYDDKGRAIYAGSLKLDDQSNVIQRHYTGSQYDFAGRVLVTKHQSFNANSQDGQTTHSELIKNTYNVYTGQLEQVTHRVNNHGAKLLVSYLYDDMGRIKKETLGNSAEERNYDYDMNGRLTGINAMYAERGIKNGQSHSFGEILKYDYGFSKPRYDGKVSGMVWRGAGATTSKPMAYGYDYDEEGRLISAEFREGYVNPQIYPPMSPTSWSNADRDYTVSNLNYDRNGNILSMDQRGMGIVQGGMQPVDMDQLSYAYEANSNQLTKVTDQVQDDYHLGDFINGNSGQSIDYAYDANGNLTKDLNKGISNISYTFFNKPQTITFSNGNTISYSYDAAGGKVQELIMNNSVAKRTDYIGNFIYQNDSLQYALTSVGRTIWENGIPKEEFFVKDHLGNVRSVVEIGQMNFVDYLGSYELASANLENLVFDFHGDIRDDKPGSLDPLDLKAGRLNGAEDDRRIGTALLLKVMAGDRVEINADNYYENYMPGSDDDPVTAEDLLENILTVLSGGAGGMGEGEIHNPRFVNDLFHPANFLSVEDLLRKEEDPQRPKAYLNYILFDEHMEIVRTFTGSFQANGNGAWQEIGTTAPMEIPANGYLAVYLSNQSRPSGCHVCGDVFFDKVKVRFSQGKLKEETHYYPYGLPMGNAGSTASDFLPNRRKYQSNEYIKDLSLNWMDFNFRQYDPQLGRFMSVDPLAASGGQERLSPYAAMGNQPEFAVDPDGLIPGLAFQTASGAGMGGFEGGFAEGSLALRAPWQDENSLFFSIGGGGSWTDNASAKYIVDYANWVAKMILKRQLEGESSGKGSYASNYGEKRSDFEFEENKSTEGIISHESGKYNYSLGKNSTLGKNGIEFIFVSLINTSDYTDVEWVQSIYTDLPKQGKPVKKWYLDGYPDLPNPPFYFSKNGPDRMGANRNSLNYGGVFFADSPGRAITDGHHFWVGQLSLVGKPKVGELKGIYVPIITIKYGYVIHRNGNWEPSHPVISIPNQEQINFINRANR